jgi:putative ABC transport system permease protein
MKLWRQGKEKDLDRELRSHLELEAEGQRECGLSAAQAEYAARRALGNTTLLKEEVPEMWRWNWVDGLARDFHYGLRQFRRNLGFTAIVIVTLALGVGGNIAVFSILRGVLVRSLPFRDPDRLVAVWEKDTERQTREKVAGGDYTDWKARNHVFEDLAYSWDNLYTLTGSGDPQTLAGYQFSPNFLSLVGARPLLGRTFQADDGQPGRDRVVVLSYHLWASTFQGDTSIVGRTIRLDGNPYLVVGVMPRKFAHPSGKVDLWTPLPFPNGLAQNWGFHVFQVLARLKPTVSFAQAQGEMSALARQSTLEHPRTNLHTGVELEPIHDLYVGNIRPALWVLQIAVFIMLLIACGNVANMLLARASTSEREVAVRLALGARRSRLLRQYLAQGLVMAGSGAAMGIAVAFWGVRVLLRLFRDQLGSLPLPNDAAAWIDWPVLSFAAATAALVGLIFGVVPVLRNASPSLEALRASGRAVTDGPGSVRLRGVLIVGQVALSLVLLIGAGLLIQSFVRLENQSLGFQSHHVLSFVLSFPPNRYAGLAKTAPFLEQMVTRIRAVPGVESAATISTLPLTGMDARRAYSNPDAPAVEPQMVQYRVITPDYFQVMHIPLKSGRFFRDADRQGSPDVVIVNEKFARQLWPQGDAVGKMLNVADLARIQPMQIVGVVGDVRHNDLASEPPIEVYRPAYQTSWPFVGVVVRAALEPDLIAKSVREAVWAVDGDLPINSLRAMDDLAADSIALRRSSMLLVSVFAAFALFLAFLGIYTVISYAVTLRTHEIGVRMALGGTTGEMVRMMLRQSIVLTLTGVAIGLLGALGVTRFLTALLFGVTATDATTMVLAIIAMTALAMIAAYVPARRASLVDPMVALRYE